MTHTHSINDGAHASTDAAPDTTRPEDRASDARTGGPGAAFSPWYSPHTGSDFSKTLTDHDLQTRQKRAKIYPAGVKIEAVKNPFLASFPVGCIGDEETTRGTIEGFSHEAARRLREWFMTRKVDGCELWAVTLTTHALMTPDQWRGIMKRFRTALKEVGWAGVWRVELQRRKAPHAHVAMWLPPGVTLDDVAALWLRSSGEAYDAAARAHAVHGRMIPADETGWAVYMGLHDGKHKTEQLGWKGKQWGIWNREAFTERAAVEFVLDEREHALFLRILRNWDVVDRMRRERAAEVANDQRMIAMIKEVTGGKLPGCLRVVYEPQKRPKPRYLHRGNLLRLLDGAFVEFVVAAIRSGRVGREAPPQARSITRDDLAAMVNGDAA